MTGNPRTKNPPSKPTTGRRMTEEQCAALWSALWRRQAGYVGSLAGFVSAVPVAMLLSRWIPSPLHFILPAAAALALYAGMGRRLIRWPCPRCGRSFSTRGGLGRTMPLRRTCAHCGLPFDACEW